MTIDAQLTDEFKRRLQWLIAFRALFAVFLLGSTLFFTRVKNFHYAEGSILLLYVIAGSTLVLSACYAVFLRFVKRKIFFTYLQICIDTVAVTLIVYITGCYYSAFTFLYLIVIISACFFLFRRGGMIIAALSSIQYGIMIDLEYYGLITPADINFIVTDATLSGPNVLYKTIIMMIACFAVAFLTSVLVEQERKARGELLVMRKYVRRVERMAAVGEMAAGLAHEIKNPLAALTGAIEMLEDDGISRNSDDDRLMKIIQREAKRLNSLVTNFLLFAKPHKGNIKNIPLGQILRETLDLFETGLKHKGDIQCVAHITEDIWVDMDPEYLRQILWNLLLNAADAINETKSQAGTITVNLYTAKNKMVRLEIIDDGCGMSADVADVIFDPFFTTKSKGTGLGLSVVHRLVESYGGHIDFESVPGKGTKFILYLTRTGYPG
jgi:two-component system sensor histidine kinase PilS (NtrC family)